MILAFLSNHSISLAFNIDILLGKYRFRKAMLYPTELRGHVGSNITTIEHDSSECVTLISRFIRSFPAISRGTHGENLGKTHLISHIKDIIFNGTTFEHINGGIGYGGEYST